MTKRFYLATRKDRSDVAATIVDGLKRDGWERTYTWTAQDGGTREQYAAIALAELAGVAEADVLVVLLPGGYGTHVEIGAALAAGKRVVLHAPDQQTLETPYPCVFHYHPNVSILIGKSLDIDALTNAMKH